MHEDADRVQAGLLPLVDGIPDASGLPGPVPVQADVDGVRTHRPGGQHGTVQHQVRRAGQQRLILAAGRLALRAVGDDHLPAVGLGHDGQLPVHREGRAAPAGQAGGLDITDQRAGPAPVRRRVCQQTLQRMLLSHSVNRYLIGVQRPPMPSRRAEFLPSLRGAPAGRVMARGTRADGRGATPTRSR